MSTTARSASARSTSAQPSTGRPSPGSQVGTPRPRRMQLDDEFYCRPRRRRLSLEKCLEDYMNANAFGTKRAACWRCPQGCNIRRQFADDAT